MSARTIGNYEIEGLLGEGGIGQVFAAHDTVLGRKVAIKMLRPELSRDRNFVERFHIEAKSLGTLNHSNITTIYALHAEGEEAFMVMELVHGQTIEALLQRVHRLTLRDTLAVLAQAIPGIRYAHRRGLVHRDLKPANLMVTDDGIVKIMDFGIARVQGSQHVTRVGEFCGTFVYASPEQIRGEEVDERSDLYSLGIVCYRMLAGNAPFTGDNEYALMTAQLQTPPPPLHGKVPDLDEATEQVLMRALAKRPEDRFASVEEFGRAVGAMALRGDSVEILAQLYARAFSEKDLDATRVVGGRPLSHIDPTMPSNRRGWQPPDSGSRQSLSLSPSAATALSRPSVSARARTVDPAPSHDDFALPNFAFVPPAADRVSHMPAPAPAKARSPFRPMLIGFTAVAIPLLASGGYYWTTLDAPTSIGAPVSAVGTVQSPPPSSPPPIMPAETAKLEVPPPPKIETTKVEPTPLPGARVGPVKPEPPTAPPLATPAEPIKQAEPPTPPPARIETVKVDPVRATVAAPPPAKVETAKTEPSQQPTPVLPPAKVEAAKTEPAPPPISPPPARVEPTRAETTFQAPAVNLEVAKILPPAVPSTPDPIPLPPAQAEAVMVAPPADVSPAIAETRIPAPAPDPPPGVKVAKSGQRAADTAAVTSSQPPAQPDSTPPVQDAQTSGTGSGTAPTAAPVQVASVAPQRQPEPKSPLGPRAEAEPPMPEGDPDLKGKVSGVKRIDEIEVAGRWIKIYGIVDRARGSREAQQVQAVLRYLKPARNVLVCYRKTADTYRCYADGQDIAQLALLDGAVQLAPNAPAEYRALAQKR